MQLPITCKAYLDILGQNSNAPASMKLLLAPFGIRDLPVVEDKFLLVGHVADAVSERFLTLEPLKAEDVLEIFEELS